MRDAVPPCEMCYRGGAGAGAPEPLPPPPGPPPTPDPPIPIPRRTRGRLGRAVTAGPRAPTPSMTPRVTPGRRTRTPPQQPSGRGGPARADRHRNLHAPRLQNHPPNNLPALRLDPGLCNRFGQTASLRPPGWAARVAATAPGAPDAETCTSHSKVQFQPSFSSAKCTPRTQNAHLDEEGAGRPGGSREGRPDTAFRTPYSEGRASCSTDRPLLTPSTLTPSSLAASEPDPVPTRRPPI